MGLASGLNQPVHRRLRQLIGLLLVFTMGACHIQRGGNVSSTPVASDDECQRTNQTLHWDFSDNYNLATVGFPQDCWETRYNIFIADSTIEVLLTDGLRIGPLESHQIAVSKSGLEPGLINDVLIAYGIHEHLTAEETYSLAMIYGNLWDSALINIERWYAET